MRSGVWIYVWQDLPSSTALQGYNGALVRAANGNGTKNPAGFDFAANYDRWVARFGTDRVQPWTYLYPSSDGALAAKVLINSAGKCDTYQCDLEDAVPPATIRAFCDTLHALVPGCKVVFDSYPTRAQFVRIHGAPGAATWDQAVASFDIFCPQVYYTSQFDDGWEDEFGNKPIWPAFSPANTASWDYFQSKLNRFGITNLWRYPMTDSWQGKLIFKEVDNVSQADVINALRSDEGQRLLRSAALLGSQDTLRVAVGKDKADPAGDYFDGLRADVAVTRANVAGLTDDEAKFVEALAGSEGRILAAFAAAQTGDPTDPASIARLVDLVQSLPEATVTALWNAIGPNTASLAPAP